MTDDDALKIYIALATEEYKTLRDESKQSNINMWTAMQWGGALIGVTIGVGLSQWTAPSPVTPLAFDIVVPTFSAFIMIFWLGEAARLKRAGDYLCLVEQKLSLLLENSMPQVLRSTWPEIQRRAELALHLREDDPTEDDDLVLADPLAWEQWLRLRRGRSIIDGHLEKLFQLRLAFFLALSWGSWSFGLLYFRAGGGSALDASAHWTILAIGFTVCVLASVAAWVVGNELRKTARGIKRVPHKRSPAP